MVTLVGNCIATLKTTEAKNFLQYANKKRLEGCFNDVSIVVGNENIPANKLVLSCFSKVFEQMFNTEMREKYEHSVVMDNFEKESVKDTINFMYTGTLDIKHENVVDVLAFAHHLQMDEIVKFCFNFLEPAIDIDNCFEIFQIADLYESTLLQKSVNVFIENNFDAVISTEGFKMQSKEILIACIMIPYQKDGQAEKVCNALVSWIKHDLNNRRQELSDLFQMINVNNLSFEFLTTITSKEDLIFEIPVCAKLLFKAVANIANKALMEKSGVTRLLSFGGYHNSDKVIEIYSCTKQPELNYPALPMPVYGHSCVKSNDVIYCIGGREKIAECVITNNVWKLNTKKKVLRWEKVALMKSEKMQMGAAVYCNCIVVTGGLSCANSLSSSEVYYPGIDEWRSIASLNESRSGHALVSCQGQLYAIGGFRNEKFLDSVECLTDLNGRWIKSQSMRFSRQWAAAVNCNDAIYVIGGRSAEGLTLKSVEKYDLVRQKWCCVSSMNIERRLHSAAVINGKIFVVGGYDASSSVIHETECYDPFEDNWLVIGKIRHKLHCHSIIAL